MLLLRKNLNAAALRNLAGCRDHVPASLAFYFRRFDQPPSGFEHNTTPESFLLFMNVVIPVCSMARVLA